MIRAMWSPFRSARKSRVLMRRSLNPISAARLAMRDWINLISYNHTTMANADLIAEVERLKAENERLKSQRGRSVSLKVSEKGGVSVYGLGRFPVTLYKEQWTKLLAMADEIRAFIKEHDAELKAKPEV
jgi:hypothetical protein